MEPGEAFAELWREDVPPGAGPLTQLDESGPRCFSHPQQSVQPASCPARGHQSQGVEEEEGTKFEEKHQCTEGETKKKNNFVHLDFS